MAFPVLIHFSWVCFLLTNYRADIHRINAGAGGA
jgi:hypothetical protein